MYEKQAASVAGAKGTVVNEHDEDPWVVLPSPAPFGLSARAQRERERERRLHAHVSRHREHGSLPPRRDRGLTREEIVAVALSVADTEGVAAVSMRRIARELNAGAMSLYWHVASKEELQDLMLESLEAEIQVPEPTGDWHADLRTFAGNMRAALLRHEWAMEFKGFRPPSGPNDAQNAERMFGLLDDLGLDTKLMIWIVMSVGTYVMGAVLREIQEKRFQRETEQAMAGMTQQEIAAATQEFTRRLLASGRYPHIARFLEEDIDPDSPETRDARFEFGLDCLLDGIAAQLPAGH
jgi:AcrR family transcriptional regulator